jgi:hypothetical protein
VIAHPSRRRGIDVWRGDRIVPHHWPRRTRHTTSAGTRRWGRLLLIALVVAAVVAACCPRTRRSPARTAGSRFALPQPGTHLGSGLQHPAQRLGRTPDHPPTAGLCGPQSRRLSRRPEDPVPLQSGRPRGDLRQSVHHPPRRNGPTPAHLRRRRHGAPRRTAPRGCPTVPCITMRRPRQPWWRPPNCQSWISTLAYSPART